MVAKRFSMTRSTRALLAVGIMACQKRGAAPPVRSGEAAVTTQDVVPEVAPDGGPPRVNPIAVENALSGTEAWQLARPADEHEVEGYASTTSAVAGRAFGLHVNVSAAHDVRWEAYRIGHYQGTGGRLVASGGPQRVTPQPSCPVDRETGAIECRWGAAFTVTPDASWVTGAYLVKLIRDDGYEWYVPMTVRETAPRAPLLFQASVNTWQAYNNWGGTSLYVNATSPGTFTGDHAYRVSFDRPYAEDRGAGQFLWWEMYMARWLEERGYDVAYVTNTDVDASPELLLRRRMVLVVGHDEYWTAGERDAMERARNAGVSLGFFSADSGTFHVRHADSASGVPRRQIIGYKVDAQEHDPQRGTPQQTTRFALAPLSRPENALLGVMYAQWSGGARFPMVVRNPEHWVFAGTGVARGDTLGFIVGSEWDRVHDNGLTPAGLEILTESPGLSTEGTLDVSHATVYHPTPTSLVFAAGTLSWAQGLARPGVADPRIQRMTENILARAGLPLETPTEVSPQDPPENPGTATSVEVLAGSGVAGYLDGTVESARFDGPAGVAAGRDGTVYVTDARNHRVRVIRADGSVTTLAGCGPTGVARSETFRDGTGADACFDMPTGVAVGPEGTVYVSDTWNHRIRAITPEGVVSTYAGTGDQGFHDARDLHAATFALPRGLAFAGGALYVADAGNGAVRRITAAGVTTVARDLDGPRGIAVGPGRKIYVTLGDATIRTVGRRNTLLAGSPNDHDSIEGVGEEARLRPGDGVAVFGGQLVFADSNNHRVRSVALNGAPRVTTLVGDGRYGAGTGRGATARVAVPRGIALYRDGLVIADAANHRVLYVRP